MIFEAKHTLLSRIMCFVLIICYGFALDMPVLFLLLDRVVCQPEVLGIFFTVSQHVREFRSKKTLSHPKMSLESSNELESFSRY